MVLEDACLVHGIIAAPGPAGEALRQAISEVPERVHSREEFVDEVRGLADHADFVLEVEGDELELSSYAWDREWVVPAFMPLAAPLKKRAGGNGGAGPVLRVRHVSWIPTAPSKLAASNGRIGQSPDGPVGTEPPTVRDPATGCRRSIALEAFAVGEIQAAQLVVFLVAMAGLLLALEIGLRRVHRRR